MHLHYRRELWLPAVPVLLIDADLDARIARKFWPHAKVDEIPARQNATVVQVSDKPCSMRFLLGAEGGDEAEQRRAGCRLTELQRTLARILAGGGLLVTYKDALERLELPEAVRTLHLGHLRGRDGFKNLDTAMVAGRLEPAPLVVERMARALFGDEAEALATIAPNERGVTRYPTEQRRYRITGGAAGAPIAVSVHPDPRGQAILEQVRECELLQAVARLWLVHRFRPATVYLLTNLPLDLDVAEVTTWGALTRDRAAEACRRWNGVWLVSASEQARCAPDLWATEKAAKRAAERANEAPNPFRTSSRGPWGLIPPYPEWATVPLARDGATLVAYRLAGQRGSRPHRAYLPGDVYDAEVARAELEAVAGPVAKLRIVGTVHAARPGVVVSRDEPPPLEIRLAARVPPSAARAAGLARWGFPPWRGCGPPRAAPAQAPPSPPRHPSGPPAGTPP